MTWLLTVTGHQVDLVMVDQAEITILGIAHALSLLNRFHGHTSRPYSVAEHSLLVAEIMERDLGEHRPDVLLAALLHDAHEAHVGDMASPLKAALRRLAELDCRKASDYDRFEQVHADAVRSRFGVLQASRLHAHAIAQADQIALATERRDLMPAASAGHPDDPLWPPVTWLRLSERAGMEWTDWRQAFLDRFAVLYSLAVEREIDD